MSSPADQALPVEPGKYEFDRDPHDVNSGKCILSGSLSMKSRPSKKTDGDQQNGREIQQKSASLGGTLSVNK
jgi:hypothetical protein